MYFMMRWLPSSSCMAVLWSSGPCRGYNGATCLFHAEHDSCWEYYKPSVDVTVMSERYVFLCPWMFHCRTDSLLNDAGYRRVLRRGPGLEAGDMGEKFDFVPYKASKLGSPHFRPPIFSVRSEMPSPIHKPQGFFKL